MPAASPFNEHGLLEEGPVTKFVMLPYFHEDEAMLVRPSHLDRSPIDLAGPEGLDAMKVDNIRPQKIDSPTQRNRLGWLRRL